MSDQPETIQPTTRIKLKFAYGLGSLLATLMSWALNREPRSTAMSVAKSTTIRTIDSHFDIEVIRTPNRAIIAIHDTLLDRVMPPIVLTPDQAEALARALRDEPGAEDTHAD